jgi:hypothetical protein
MGKAIINIDGVDNKFDLFEKTFKTGSKGFHGFGKMFANGKLYQVNILVVEIGSKNKGK